jgi:predicted Zn-dependent protease
MVNIAKRRRPWRRYILIALALAGLCALLYSGGRSQYRQWRGAQLARQANAFLEMKDPASAALTAQRGLRVDFDSVECWQVLAKVGEQRGRSDAIYARSRIVELQKGSLEAVLSCAETALRFGDPGSAARALGKVSEGHREDGRYQAMRGKIGAASGKLDEAVDGYARALEFDPQNEEYRLAHAVALLNRGWIEDRAAARSTLEGLSAHPKLRLNALRALVKDSLANKETGNSLQMARELASAPGAAFSEKVILLDLLRRSASDDFAPTLEALEKEARGNPAQMAELELWMSRSGRFGEAIEWAARFTPEEWGDPRVCAAVAANLFAKANWEGLELFTEEGNWQGLEYLRCALHARALRERGQFLEAGQQWNAAVTAATRVPRGTTELTKFIADWGWDMELIDLLRALVKDPREAGWAARMLLPLVTRNKDTPGLWEATARFMETDKTNDAAANNFAMYSLLLRRDSNRACELARKLCEKHPHEGGYVSTYAYSLHLLGQTRQALQAMEALGPQQLETPEVAAYYGILLAADHDWLHASRFLELAKRANLLPEEDELIAAARRLVDEERIGPEPPSMAIGASGQ